MPHTVNNTIIFHEPEGLPHVAAVEGTDISNRFPRHVHSSYIFTLVLQGSRKMIFKNGATVFRAGEMCILPPGTSHTCESVSDTTGSHSYRALCVTAKYMEKLTGEITGRPGNPPDFDCTVPHREFDGQSFADFFTELNVPGSLLERETALTTFLYHAILNLSCGTVHPDESGPQIQALERVHRHITANFRMRITLDDLAQTGCISPFHLQKLFVGHYGLSPQEMVISCRVKEAERLLKTGQPIAEAALNSGFSDQSHFSRHFKRVTGITPGRFLKDNLHR
ncbi:AraC family transcriptional regulator [Maridesulfovibrio sp. FT414]|uniref:AraC family transcriptional regulator n=1 Tax=Maridesulfovibrio sp. FT414 TaxID=2979469 RepID=UPI003D801495